MFNNQSQNLDALCLVVVMLIFCNNIYGFFVFNIFPLTHSFGDCRFLCIDVCLHEKGSTEEDQGYKQCADES